MRDVHKTYVWAFGDSPLDLVMLCKADQSIVVVGEEDKRSKSMDTQLTSAIKSGCLFANQALLPSHALPRMNSDDLPLIQLTDPSLFARFSHPTIQTVSRSSRYSDLPDLKYSMLQAKMRPNCS